MGKSGGSIFNTTFEQFPLKILPGERPLEGMCHFCKAPKNLPQRATPLSPLPGPPSHPRPRVTSCGSRALSARRSGDKGHGWVSGSLTGQVFFLVLEQNQPQPRRKLQFTLRSGLQPSLCSSRPPLSWKQ